MNYENNLKQTAMKSNKQNAAMNGFNHLVSRLKAKDAMHAFVYRVIQIIFIVFIPLFMLFTLVPYFITGNITPIISMPFYIFAFVIFAYGLTRSYKTFKNVDYSLPTLQMLKQAANRYKPVNTEFLWFILALGVISIGLSIEKYGKIIAIQTLILPAGLIVLGLITGLITWYFKFKPIRDDVIRLIKEIEN